MRTFPILGHAYTEVKSCSLCMRYLLDLFDDWTYHVYIYIRIIYTVNSTLSNLWESDNVYICVPSFGQMYFVPFQNFYLNLIYTHTHYPLNMPNLFAVQPAFF